MKYNPLRSVLALAALAFSAPASRSQTVSTLPEPSPRASVTQVVGISTISVDYHRPSVKGRKVWGDLVPFGFNDLGFGTARAAPWRAGANENTVVTFGDDVVVEGSALKAGSYGLSMAIAPDGTVTVIFSRDTRLWGSFFYDQSRDALRVTTHWEDAPFHEQLEYEFSSVTDDSAVLALNWERKSIPIRIKFDTPAIVEESLRSELHGRKGFTYEPWVEGSQYLLEQNRDLPTALAWADFAISDRFIGVRSFTTLSCKADILEKMGREADAAAIMDEAVKIGSPAEIHSYGRRLLAAHKPDRAMAIFRLNASLHPGAWPVDYGLARGYSAMGDFKSAIEAMERAQKAVPPGDTANAAAVRANLEKLKHGVDIN
jgi:hypothetical protein